MPQLSEVWNRLSTSEKRRSLFAGALCMLGIALTADMYMLKQRPDFKQKFLPPEEEEENEQPWKKAKQQSQIDAEIAERTAQLTGAAAAAAANPAVAQARQAAVQQPQAEGQEPQAAPLGSAGRSDNANAVQNSWWSVKWRW